MTVSTTYTNEQIASDYALWMTYVDPNGEIGEAEFAAMTLDERIALIVSMFGADAQDVLTATDPE